MYTCMYINSYIDISFYRYISTCTYMYTYIYMYIYVNNMYVLSPTRKRKLQTVGAGLSLPIPRAQQGHWVVGYEVIFGPPNSNIIPKAPSTHVGPLVPKTMPSMV